MPVQRHTLDACQEHLYFMFQFELVLPRRIITTSKQQTVILILHTGSHLHVSDQVIKSILYLLHIRHSSSVEGSTNKPIVSRQQANKIFLSLLAEIICSVTKLFHTKIGFFVNLRARSNYLMRVKILSLTLTDSVLVF